MAMTAEERKAYMKEYNRQYREKNIEKLKAYDAQKYEKNKKEIRAKYKQYAQKNKEKLNEYKKQYFQKNPDKLKIRNEKYWAKYPEKRMAYGMKRHANKIQRTPCWLTDKCLKKIETIYAKAKKLQEKTGIKHHVDHIIPLQGKLVSGLHVPSNLRVVTAKENLSKSNRYKLN